MANQLTAAKYNGPATSDLKKIEDGIGAIDAALDPFNGTNTGQTPFYSTGARCLVRIGGKPAGICTSFSYNLSYNVEEIRTLDSNIPYDVDIAALTVRAQLNTIVDPTGGPEVTSMFATMASSVHQPLVEMQVLDRSGTSVFFTRGVFTSIGFNTGKGQLSSYSANFIGIFMQNYVDQSFVPYSTTGALSGVLSSATALLGSLSGGIL